MISSFLVNRIQAQSVIAFVAIVLVVGTVSPALAAKEKVTICHFDEDLGTYDLISISKNALKAHAKNHAMDTLPTEAGDCPGEPLTAPKNSKKMEICHFDEDLGTYDLISISKKALKAHAKNHAMDIIPAPEGGCPEPAP